MVIALLAGDLLAYIFRTKGRAYCHKTTIICVVHQTLWIIFRLAREMLTNGRALAAILECISLLLKYQQYEFNSALYYKNDKDLITNTRLTCKNFYLWLCILQNCRAKNK